MRISRLRLLGFKSFVEPTELIIEKGLTGVVGPNGCGKSNLLEALRWVMGETSHKSMRAAAMDDVIFSGTNTRPARNMAEVTILVDNTERLAPPEFNDADEIEITRRIEREAGSTYRVNGRETRARDVKILFEDAATGARSPALVRQGQIGDIVNAKPEARRRILEDAAGTAGLHSRRHEAELRLRAAENNLARLDDVVGGLNAQVESLKRQARQARRYKDLSEEIRRAEALLLHLVWTGAEADAISCEQRLSEALTTLGEAVRRQSEALAHETAITEALQPLRDAAATRSAVFGRLQVEHENFEREAARASERAKELTDRAEQLERDLAREQNFATESESIIARLKAEIATLQTAETGEAEAGIAARNAVEKIEARLAETEASVSTLTAQLASAHADRRNLEEAARQATVAVSRIETQIANLDREMASISANAPDANNLNALTSAGRALSAEIETAEAATAVSEKNVAVLSERLRAERDEAAKARLALNTLRTERETLARLLIPDGENRTEAAIVDAIQVTPGFETALGAALGDDLEAPASQDAPIHWRKLEPATGDAPLPSEIEPLARYVSAPPELARRLDQIGVVGRGEGARLQRHLKPGQRLVSKAGDLWRWDGFVAASEGTTAAARRLEQRNRLLAIEHEEAAAAEAAEAKTAAEYQTTQALTTAQHAERQARALWRDKQAELTRTRDALTTIERAARETESKLAQVSGARARAQEELKSARARARELTGQIAALDAAAMDQLEAELTATRSRAQAERSQAAEHRATLAGLDRAKRERKSRLEKVREENDGWIKRRAGACAQTEALEKRVSETRDELQTYADLPGKMDARRQEILGSLEVAEHERKAASDKLASVENELGETTQALRAAQADVSEAREIRARIETTLENARLKCAEAADRIQETFSVQPVDCLAIAEMADGAELPAQADVEGRLGKLRVDRERLGGVNLQADEDLGRIAKEVDRIETERADVDEAIAKLRTAIQQLNRQARKRLREAFETVDKHFQHLFSTLFGGGEARLEMIESEEDPLQGGLEIVARPPGKKPATLSLLSGGEQTLTALSLIFAVFLTNPSPICVLDEVDAPLDDSNVDRFCTLMETMASETATRFLVITHHPMTMTRMNRLFGVTMGERGVSQLVSVDLETAQGFREAS